MGMSKMGQLMQGMNQNQYGGIDPNILMGMMGKSEDRKYSEGLAEKKYTRGRTDTQSDLATKQGYALELQRERNKTSGLTTEEKNWRLAQKEPEFKKWIMATGRDNTPAAVKEWNMYKGLNETQKTQYLNMKRAGQNINLGASVVTPDPANPAGPPIVERQMTVPPQDKPDFKQTVKRQEQIGIAEGKSIGEGLVDLPKVAQKLDSMLSLVDQTLAHPGMKDVVGFPDNPFMLKGHMPGSKGAGFRALHDQIKSTAFLEAFQQLKGGGHITEIEGEKATEAAIRANLSQDEQDYINSMREFQYYARLGFEKSKKIANPKHKIKYPKIPEHLKDFVTHESTGGQPKRRKTDAPPGIDQSVWDHMTPKQRKLFK